MSASPEAKISIYIIFTLWFSINHQRERCKWQSRKKRMSRGWHQTTKGRWCVWNYVITINWTKRIESLFSFCFQNKEVVSSSGVTCSVFLLINPEYLVDIQWKMRGIIYKKTDIKWVSLLKDVYLWLHQQADIASTSVFQRSEVRTGQKTPPDVLVCSLVEVLLL